MLFKRNLYKLNSNFDTEIARHVYLYSFSCKDGTISTIPDVFIYGSSDERYYYARGMQISVSKYNNSRLVCGTEKEVHYNAIGDTFWIWSKTKLVRDEIIDICADYLNKYTCKQIIKMEKKCKLLQDRWHVLGYKQIINDVDWTNAMLAFIRGEHTNA